MTDKKIGLISLTALVFSSMVGSGIFSLPQNMAEVAGLQAELYAWGITGVGILSLAGCFLFLSRLRPDLDEGIYSYARAGFGDLMGFFSAWGYWLCSTIGVVAYLVVAFEALGGIFDTPEHIIFGQGNTWISFLGSSIILWLVHILLSRGIRQAALLNLLGSLAKTVPLLIFIAIVAYHFDPAVFMHDIQAQSLHQPLHIQIKDTMLITLWVFTGIEGAAVLSARASNKRHIGQATFIGVLLAGGLYVAISLLSRGILERETLAQLTNPSMAGVLSHLIGGPGRLLVSFGMIIAVLASYISWIIYAVEVPYSAARNNAFPKLFNQTNTAGIPKASLWLTSLTVQGCLLLIMYTGDGYNALIRIATSMILVPYLLVGLYFTRLSFERGLSWLIKGLAIVASIYGAWLLYAADIKGLLLSILLYAPGLGLYLYSRRQAKHRIALTNVEKFIVAGLFIAVIPALRLFIYS